MKAAVLDASALLALLLDEPGAAHVRSVLDGAAIAAVNLAEVVGHFARLGGGRADIQGALQSLPMQVVSADIDLSVAAGMLRPITEAAGLSLGDRYCLALAVRNNAVAVTADRSWARISDVVDVQIQVIR